MGDERCEQLVGWLQANWTPPDAPVAALEDCLEPFTRASDVVLIMDFWAWNDAVVVLAPANALIGITGALKTICPDGFLVADQTLSRGLLVDFDEIDGARMSLIETEPFRWA